MKPTRPVFPLYLILSVLILASLACSLTDRVTNPTEAQPPTGQVGQPTAAEENEQTTAAAEPGQAEDIDIPEVSGDLNGLTSYSLDFKMVYSGTNADGVEKTGSFEMVQDVDNETHNNHLAWTGTGDPVTSTAEPQSRFEFYNVAGVQYMLGMSGETDQCISFSSSDNPTSDMAIYSPQDWFNGINGARLVGRGEMVNGVATDHYTFDQNNVNLGAVSSASGEIWIAQDGGYTVRMTAQAQGTDFTMGDIKNGQMTWEYNLTQVNQPVQITLPESCANQAPATDIPIPDSAKSITQMSGFTSFSSDEPAASLADFYRSELPNQGWEITAEENPTAGMVSMTATKEGRTLTILINTDGDTASVMITEAQP